jgi:hypothetical protein
VVKPFDMATLDKYRDNGKEMIRENYIDYHDGDGKTDSPQTMLEFSEEMYKTSKNLYEAGDYKTESVNFFDFKEKAINSSQKQTLNDAAIYIDNGNEEQLQEIENDIKVLEKVEKSGVDEKRNYLKEFKNKCLTSFGDEIEQESTSSNEGVKNEEPSSGKDVSDKGVEVDDKPQTPVQTPKGRDDRR